MEKLFSSRFRRIAVIGILLPALLLTGCWDSQEIDTIALVLGIGLDVSDTPDEILFTAQVGKASSMQGGGNQNGGGEGGGKGGEENSLIMQTRARGLLPAIDSFSNKSSRTPFLHHNQVVIFGRKLAENGIRKYLDGFLRYYEMRTEMRMVIADNLARDILTAKTEPEALSSIQLSDILRSETDASEYLNINLIDFISTMLESTSSTIAPVVKVEDNAGFPTLSLSGMAVFKDDKMVSELNRDQLRGYLWAMGKLNEPILNVNIASGYANLTVSKIKTHVTPILGKDGQASILLKIRGNAIMQDLMGFDSITLNEATKIIQNAAQETISGYVRDCLSATQISNTDIFQFGEAFHRKYPKKWSAIREQWDRLYPQLILKTDIKLNMVSSGKISRSLEMKEEK